MITSGFIVLHRRILDNWLWQVKPFGKGQAWLDLLLMAPWKDHEISGKRIIKRGQIHTTLRFLGERWGWTKDRVSRFLRETQIAAMTRLECATRRDTGGTIIEIVNYGLYQGFAEVSESNDRTKRDTDCETIETQTRHRQGLSEQYNNETILTTHAPNSGAESHKNERCMKSTQPKTKRAPRPDSGGACWAQWVDLRTERGMPAPLPAGANVAAAKQIAKLIPDPAERSKLLAAYLDDSDQWLEREGHALRLLPARLDRYRNRESGIPVLDENDLAALRIGAELRAKTQRNGDSRHDE